MGPVPLLVSALLGPAMAARPASGRASGARDGEQETWFSPVGMPGIGLAPEAELVGADPR
ncbi:hypothetical protein C6W96_03315 [Streptomyces sp. CS149]|uniref:Uncharacterized protein n=1 Tax=Streptomyces globisporus TaxID=1908 RepID=A0A423V4T4_STRGL|nr:hypothetical protein C6W96_03315 [Streptomyces sp. CS149]ROV69604.1 hypothetical protein D3105_04985 [Streptomyces globisporus]